MTSGVMAGDDTGLNGANRLMHCMAWYLAMSVLDSTVGYLNSERRPIWCTISGM